jgi:hypothetical protein
MVVSLDILDLGTSSGECYFPPVDDILFTKADEVPTGCATRWLLGVNRLQDHCRSPHACKAVVDQALLLNVGTRPDDADVLCDQDGPTCSSTF